MNTGFISDLAHPLSLLNAHFIALPCSTCILSCPDPQAIPQVSSPSAFSSQPSSYLLLSPKPCSLLTHLFFLVGLAELPTQADLHQGDGWSPGPRWGFHTDHLCARAGAERVSRKLTALPPLWQELQRVHAQLPVLRQGPGSAHEAGQRLAGKSIWGCSADVAAFPSCGMLP